MPTSARKRRSVDAQRISEAVSRPGIDPRVWLTCGRVDQVDFATWDPSCGWLVDVTPYGTNVHSTEPIPCRVLSPLGGDGYGEWIPMRADVEALIGLVDGDPTADPVVLGYVSNADGSKIPTTVAELPIEADSQSALLLRVDPSDCEIYKSPWSRVEHFGGWVFFRSDMSFVFEVPGTSGSHRLVIGADRDGSNRIRIRHADGMEILIEDHEIRVFVDGAEIRASAGRVDVEASSTVHVNAPSVLLGSSPGAAVATVGSIVIGSTVPMTCGGVPVIPAPPFLPTTGGGVPVAAQVAHGVPGVQA